MSEPISSGGVVGAAHVATAAGAVTSTVSGVVTYFGLSQAEWAIVGIWFGMALGLAGYVTSWYFQRKNYQLNAKRGAE